MRVWLKRIFVVLFVLFNFVSASKVFAQDLVAGEYNQVVYGFGGEMQVLVVLDEAGITDIQVVEHGETEGLGDVAMDQVIAQIIETQSLNVDAVSGATNSSQAIIQAVQDAVVEAGGDLQAFGVEVEAEQEQEEQAQELEEGSMAVTINTINQFLNESGDLGPGTIANPVAVIPIQHIDGPRMESDFYAFVNFKYVSRDYIKYQVTYISCTCREASVNYWTTAYVELTLPSSGNIEDAVIQAISFERDPQDNYTVGFWGDSDPIPNGTTFEDIKTEYIPYFVGKTVGEINGLSVMEDIDLADYQAGDGRADYTIDVFSGASVSTNNIIRMLIAIGNYHGTDEFFGGSLDDSASLVISDEEEAGQEESEAAPTGELAELPAPIDTNKTYNADSESDEESPCEEGVFNVGCSAITADNLLDYMNRPDVLYIDTRDLEDYAKKHFRNFEAIPYFAYIWNADAATNPDMIQLYGGDPTDPIPVYEESDLLLEVLFPKDTPIFLMCQSGGRVAMLMNILEARGWDMSYVYNIGGMAQYTGGEYREHLTDSPELSVNGTYNFEGLTRIVE